MISAARAKATLWLCGLALVTLPAPSQSRPGTSSSPLKNLSLEELGDVKVVSETKEPTQVWHTPAAIYVLTGEEIRRSGVTSVPDALRLIPGVNVARVNGARNWAVGIRGLGDQFSKYVLVLIDGRNVYSPLYGGVYWNINNVMLEDIDRIEVIRGPGGTIWGADAVNGVINIITKSSAETQGALLSAGGGNVDQNTEDLRFGGRRRSVTFRAYGMDFVRGPEYHVQGQQNYDNSALGQFGFRADRVMREDELTLQGDAYFGSMGDAQQVSQYTPPSVAISYQPTDVAGGNLLGRWRRQLAGNSDVYLQAFWSHDHRTGPNFGETRNTFDVDFLHRTPNTAHQQFTYGVGMRLSPSSTTITDPTDRFIPAKKTEAIYSGFLQEEVRLPANLSLIVGSKLEGTTYTGFEYQPSGRLLWTPSEHTSFWVSASRAVRTPDRVDEDIQVDVLASSTPVIFGEVIGNPALHAERLLAFEGGARTLLGKAFYLDTAAFHNGYGDLIAQGAPRLVPDVPPFPTGATVVQFQYRNGIKGTTDGFEIAPDWRPVPAWHLRAAYSYLHFNLQDAPGFNNNLTLTNLHGSSPNSQAALQSMINLPGKFELDQTIRYVGSLPAQHARAYVTGDLRVGRHVTHGFDVSVTGQNLFQPHHAEFGIDPGPNVLIKRTIYAKVVWTR